MFIPDSRVVYQASTGKKLQGIKNEKFHETRQFDAVHSAKERKHDLLI